MNIAKRLVSLALACALAAVLAMPAADGNPAAASDETASVTAAGALSRAGEPKQAAPSVRSSQFGTAAQPLAAAALQTVSPSPAKTPISLAAPAALPAASTQDPPGGESAVTDGVVMQNQALAEAIGYLKAIIAASKTGIHNFEVYLVPVGENLQEFYGAYDDNEGVHHVLPSTVFYNTQTQLIYDDDQKGALHTGFNVDVGQMMYYSPVYTWHREFGYCRAYDTLAPAVGHYVKTFRVKFSYGGLDWLVQFWKGQYFNVFTGAEFGFYNKPQGKIVEFYDCASDEWMVPMSMKLYKNGRLLFVREPELHWWMTGFKIGVSLPSMLTLEGTIEFKTAEMKDAFLAALDEEQPEGVTYSTQGNLFSFTWKG